MAKNTQAASMLPKLGKTEQVGFLLKSLQHSLRQNLEEVLRKQGLELSFAQVGCLFNLHYDPGISGAQIARRAMVSAQTMNSVLRTLEHDGHIERRPHPDSRRADSWSLTESGLAELERAREVGAAVFERMLSPLRSAEVTAFVDYLRRCTAALEQPADGDAVEQRAHTSAAQRRQKAGVSSTRNV